MHPELGGAALRGRRSSARARIVAALAECDLVICDRYAGSNAAHQGAKLEGDARRRLLDWLDEVEYGEFALPRPSSSSCSTRRSRSRASSSGERRRAGTRRWRRISTRRTPATVQPATSTSSSPSAAAGESCTRPPTTARSETSTRSPPRCGARWSRSSHDVHGVAEQMEAKRLLSAALTEGPAHAYLLHGPPGVGKKELALLFAAELLGDHARVERRSHPDLYVLEPSATRSASTTSARCATTCTCARSRPTGASTSSSAPTR